MEVLTIQNFDYNNCFNNNVGETADYFFTEALSPETVTSCLDFVTKKLEEGLRLAKSSLSVEEVLLPNDLTRSIASDVVREADAELCGLRGCTLVVNFEGQISKRLATITMDLSTPSTYELIVTLKQTTATWNSFLPQFLKKIAKGGPVMISSEYSLEKRKLYSFYSD